MAKRKNAPQVGVDSTLENVVTPAGEDELESVGETLPPLSENEKSHEPVPVKTGTVKERRALRQAEKKETLSKGESK